MAAFLICSTPVYGHVAPMLAIGKHLSERGHRVRMLTGSRYKEAVFRAGLEFAALPGAADYDDRDLKSAFPEAYGKTGLNGVRIQLGSVFVAPIPHQFHGLKDSIASFKPDAVLVDIMYFGALPLLLSAPRPPVLTIGMTPLLQSSMASRLLFHGLNKEVGRITHNLVDRKPPLDWMDWAQLSDRCLQLGIPSLERPRKGRLPSNTLFVGPVLSHSGTDFQEPAWWPELQQQRPVVHVSQGTIDNTDLGELIAPTLQGLAHEDVLVVATTGGPPVSDIPGTLPNNARVEAFIPHDKLLPHVDVMVSNGGYGGVQFALSRAVPLVVAGATADKPEVAALVAKSGAGINLRTGKPKPEAVAAAVARVLGEPRFKEAAHRLSVEMDRYSALDTIAEAGESYATMR